MAYMKVKVLSLSKSSVSPAKKLAKGTSLHKETSPVKAGLKKSSSPEAEDARARAEWKKEKRDYWSSRFRKVLSEINEKPRVKKSSFL